MPVHLSSVQSQLFHDRHQGAKESADEYAQELRKLFRRAYAGVTPRGPEGEEWGQRVLSNQFVVGLRPELKAKIVGQEGSLDQLLIRAKFEEAKGKELAAAKNVAFQKKPAVPTTPRGPPENTTLRGQNQGTNPGFSAIRPPKSGRECFNCGMEGHLARACPYPKQPKSPREAQGRKEKVMSAVTSDDSRASKEQRVEELRKQLREAEMAAAVENTAGRLSMVTASEGTVSQLGPTIFTSVEVNGIPTKALVDTGSPATIISLKFVLMVLAGERDSTQTPSQWQATVLKKFSNPEVTLRNYGGQRLNIVSQVSLNLSQGNRYSEITVLVQKNAPNDLLLGTDSQSQLGFSLVMEKARNHKIDLLTGEECPETECVLLSGHKDGKKGTRELSSVADRSSVEDGMCGVGDGGAGVADAGGVHAVVEFVNRGRRCKWIRPITSAERHGWCGCGWCEGYQSSGVTDSL